MITRRQALIKGGATLAGLTGLAGVACCGGSSRAPSSTGSTIASTWADPGDVGALQVGPGEPLVERVELGPRAAVGGTLATLAHVTDAHVLDASSPARVTFLDRLGAPFESTFRPQETLTAHVLDGTLAAIRALRPQLVIQGGDLIDNDQANELAIALAVLRGGSVRPGSGPRGYYGVQIAGDPDPFYYRPDVDAPRHPGLLGAAVRPFRARGVGARWCPVFGDHDALVAGELVPSSVTRSLAVGDRALWDLPAGLTVPPGERLTAGGSPDGPPQPLLVDQLLAQALQGPTVAVPADPARRQLAVGETVGRLAAAGGALQLVAPDRLDYSLNVGGQLAVVVLDLARRDGGSGGRVVPGQADWLAGRLAASGDRWVIVVSHQPLADALGGDSVLGVLGQHPRVIATLAGHTHRNRIVPRRAPGGGFWQIETASLIDYPQQARALRVVGTAGGGVAVQTWMVDHIGPGSLGRISRELAYLDAQGGRPQGFAGTRLDRNVVLFRRAVA
jgi:hypothetical protein